MQPTKRERIVIFAGAGLLGLFLVVQFVVSPTFERARTLRRVIGEKREVLADLRAKSQECKKLQAEVAQLQSLIGQQQEGRGLLSSVEKIRQTCGLAENVLSLKPTTTTIDNRYQETVVEVRLDGVQFSQLVSFLTQLDALKLAGGVKALDVQHADRSPGVLRATIQLATVTQAGRT